MGNATHYEKIEENLQFQMDAASHDWNGSTEKAICGRDNAT